MLSFSIWAIILGISGVVIPVLISVLACKSKEEHFIYFEKIMKIFLALFVILIIILIVSTFVAFSSDELVTSNESLISELKFKEVKLSNDGTSIIVRHDSGIIAVPVENCIIEEGKENVLKKYLKTVESSKSFFLITETETQKYDLYRLNITEFII